MTGRAYHAYFQATAHLVAYVINAGLTTTIPLVRAGPSNCCTTPSGGFHYTGSVRLYVNAGDVYGFKFGGTNKDSTRVLQGRLALGPKRPPRLVRWPPPRAGAWSMTSPSR